SQCAVSNADLRPPDARKQDEAGDDRQPPAELQMRLEARTPLPRPIEAINAKREEQCPCDRLANRHQSMALRRLCPCMFACGMIRQSLYVRRVMIVRPWPKPQSPRVVHETT